MVMEFLSYLSHWLTGGEHQYMRLYGCMRGDTFWIALTVGLDLCIASGYVIIARHWWKNQRMLPDVPAKRALSRMRNIFIFCCLCGYVFIPIKMFWPAWRLYDGVLIVLAYYTWRYALNSRELKVIYSEIGRSTRLAADLEQSQKETKEKTFFLNAISHDLRTPLNGLMLQASLAEVGVDTNDPQLLRQSIREIKLSAAAAGRMLDHLLNYGQLSECGEGTTTFRLNDVVDGVVSQHRAAALEKKLTLRSVVPENLWIRSDRGKLERILANLVENGIKFTSNGGVRVEADSDGKGIELHVIDSGIGIATEHLEHLFEEFFQVGNDARQQNSGYGLGLAIARRLATHLGGDLIVESDVGCGSRFSLLLPECVAREQHVATVQSPELVVGN